MIVIDYKDSRPLYEQITDKMKDLILKGIIRSGDQLPSVRNLAMELSINPNTIQRAYAELEREGYIYTVKGRGNYVSDVGSLVEDRKMQLRKDICDRVVCAVEFGVDIEDILNDIRERGQA